MPEDVFSSPSEEKPDESGSPASEQGGSSEGEGRTLDNVRGELLRKQEKDAAQLQEQIALLHDSVQKMAEAFQSQAKNMAERPQPARPQQPMQPNPWGAPTPAPDEYTDEQLQQALRSGRLTPEQSREVERMLNERRVESKTKELFEKRDREQQMAAAEADAENAALQSFPALRDPNSEFSRKVNAALETQRNQFGKFPHDKFDVANRVARQMGVEASRIVTPGYVGKPEASDPRPSDDEPEGLPDDRIKQIAENLKYALPVKRNPKTGRMERKQFNLKRIKERSKRYAAERDLRLRNKI
jgi:hypothetical protein